MNGNAEEIRSHTLGVYVANKPGVLARIAQVFARRGFNIDSLVVSSSRDGNFSRMTVTVAGSANMLGQVIRQVNKLVDVLHCIDHTGDKAVTRELALVKLKIENNEERTSALQVADHFAAKTVDLTRTSMIIMLSGASDKLDAAIELLKEFDVVELVRTGKVVMARGEEET